jgi:hypothetical protein
MSTSLIKFSQGATVGTSGWAFVATTGSAVTVVNNNNTGVSSWQIELVDVPSGSSVATGIIAFDDTGSTPTITITPDVAGGCYRVVLKTWSAIDRVGAPTDTDIRNIVVLDARGFASPPSQIWPIPLPPTASGMPGNKPNELNINGQERGYAGAGTDGLLDQRFNYPVITNVNISAGTTSGNMSAFVFSNSNNVSFGLNGSTLTATVNVPSQTVQTQNIVVPSAGTQTATSGTIVFSNSNGMSFGMSLSSVITASYTVPSRTVKQLVWPESPWQTNFTISNASFSLQHFNAKLDILVSQANLLMALNGNSNSSGALNISMGIYTMNGSVMSLASSNSRQVSWTSGSQTNSSSVYGGVSGTRYRTVGIGNWNITAGDYMLGMWFQTTNNGTWLAFGSEGPTIVGAQDSNETQIYLNGYSASSYTTGMIGSINVTNTNYVRTGGDALKHPGVIFLGSL